MSFYICHCGNTKENHYFRHSYFPITEVKYSIIDNETIFTLNADDFPETISEVCSYTGCKHNKTIHNTNVIKHVYDPKEYRYRKINLTIPEDTKCNHKNYGKESLCNKELKHHSSIQTHHFKTKVIINNRKDTDVIMIIDIEDEDKKIIYE